MNGLEIHKELNIIISPKKHDVMMNALLMLSHLGLFRAFRIWYDPNSVVT